ncbi:Uncharacterised protein [Citrobacter koseri]|uniref:Uncharacterized protein n=1 Tax=Citrobacter koseri TaxID=545 RepID=A0A2X2WGW4_CITKO|nr:Uncharacterised protein [Citrobacter koseri]
MLGPERMAADILLDQTALTQVPAAIHGETAAGNEATGEKIIHQVDYLFLAGRCLHQGLIERLLTVLGVVVFVKQDQRRGRWR